MDLPNNIKFVTTNSYPYKVFVEQKPRKRTVFFKKTKYDNTFTSYLEFPYVIFEFALYHVEEDTEDTDISNLFEIQMKVFFKDEPLTNDKEQTVFLPNCLPNIDDDFTVCLGTADPELYISAEEISNHIDDLISSFWQSSFLISENFDSKETINVIDTINQWEKHGLISLSEEENTKCQKKGRKYHIGSITSEKICYNLQDLSNYNKLFINLEDQTEEMQLKLIETSPMLLRLLDNPSERLQLKACEKEGYVIRYIENPSEKVKLAAVQREPYTIQHFVNPSKELQLAALNSNGMALDYLPSEYTLAGSRLWDEDLVITALKNNGAAIRYIDNPSEKLKLIDVTQYTGAISCITYPTEKVKLTVRELMEDQPDRWLGNFQSADEE